jgi:beta-xylosidase
VAACSRAGGHEPAPETAHGPNPFINTIYTADPSAHVWGDGRLYIYASQDKEPAFGCDMMDGYHVFSTDDMVNWTDHGQILEAADVPWDEPIVMDENTGRVGTFMWAPDCAYKDGKYYFYFPHPSSAPWNDTWKIGIAVSDSPASGFKILPHTLKGLPDKGEIDPCVFIDDDGQAYFYYGGGARCFGARLKDNMTEIDGELRRMEGLADFHEAAWIHKKNGLYYMSYSDNHNSPAYGGNRLRYATSSSPLGPWTSRGIYLDPTNCDTSHGSIVEYKGQWWAFYHNSDLSLANTGRARGNLRSICVDKLYHNADGTIRKIEQTRNITE